MKFDIDRLDIDKLETTAIDISKLNNVVKNDFIKKTVYYYLVKKNNAIHFNDAIDLFKKQSMVEKLKILKTKSLIMINILLLLNFIKFLVQCSI